MNTPDRKRHDEPHTLPARVDHSVDVDGMQVAPRCACSSAVRARSRHVACADGRAGGIGGRVDGLGGAGIDASVID